LTNANISDMFGMRNMQGKAF